MESLKGTSRIAREGGRPMRGAADGRVRLSIVLVNYKTSDFTLDCIRSIYDYAPRCAFEIIALDNGSDDELETALADRFPKVRFIETGQNIGFARANNLGIYNSHGDYIVLLNNDTRLIAPIFDEMIGYMGEHPKVGILGPKHLDSTGRFQLSCGRFPTFFSEIARKLIYYHLSLNDYRFRDYLDERHSNLSTVEWISGSCLLFRRELLGDTGLLDERFFMYFEDVDFCRRARDRGWEVQYIPGLSILHHGGASARKNLLSAMVENRRSQLYFSRRYYGVKGELFIRALLFMKYGFNLLKWSLMLAGQSFFGKKPLRSYQMALLAKKVIGLTLRSVPGRPQIPVLQEDVTAPAV